MKLRDFFAQLSYGEFSNLSIGENGAGTIRTEDQPRIINYVNKVLTRLHSRFAHNTHYVTIQLSNDIPKYSLRTQHAVTNTDPDNYATRYILDNPDNPFPGNLIKIVEIRLIDVSEDDASTDLLINDSKSDLSVKMLSYDTFQVSEVTEGDKVIVEASFDHPRMTIDASDLDEEITMFPLLFEALEYKVAAMHYRSMNGEQNLMKAAQLEADYEIVCRLVEDKDLLQNSSTTEHNKLANNGFI